MKNFLSDNEQVLKTIDRWCGPSSKDTRYFTISSVKIMQDPSSRGTFLNLSLSLKNQEGSENITVKFETLRQIERIYIESITKTTMTQRCGYYFERNHTTSAGMFSKPPEAKNNELYIELTYSDGIITYSTHPYSENTLLHDILASIRRDGLGPDTTLVYSDFCYSGTNNVSSVNTSTH